MTEEARSSAETSFGYRRVPEEERQTLVNRVFATVAERYDLMNDLMSGGLHRLWKDDLIAALNPPRGDKAYRLLDVAGGTGDVAIRYARASGASATAVLCDISPEMMEVGRRRVEHAHLSPRITFTQGNAEALPFPDRSFDAYTIAFGLRNVTDIDKALREAFRVLRPGGRLAVSDVIADGGASPARRAEAERSIGCASGTVTAAQYRHQLLAAGFTRIRIIPSTDAGGGLFSAVIQAVRPAAPDGMLIRPMRAGDARGVMAVYQAGLDTGLASFETAAPSWEEFDAVKLPLHRHVAASAATGQVLGWTAAWPVSVRRAYAGVIEHSIYVDPGHHGRGIGGALLAALIASSEDAGIWTVQSGVFPENTASLALHERAGFRVVGVRERVGCHHGRWRDVVAIERRSSVTGTD